MTDEKHGCPWCRNTYDTAIDREKHMIKMHSEKYFGGSDYTHVHA